MEQKNVILYTHGSSYNHGCEAIVRSSTKLLSLEKDKTLLYSNRIEGDLKYHLDDIVMVKPIAETPVEHNSILGIIYRFRSHLHSDHRKYYFRYFGKKKYKFMYDFGEVAISIGGDNYCYDCAIDELDARNYCLNKKGIKTILWGASLTEELLSPSVIDDLQHYSLIIVREKYSFDLLKKYNVQTKILCGPDPAFLLDIEETDWPDRLKHKKVIGINISPFVIECGVDENIGLKNYINLVNWILKETDYEIALIPHVVFPLPGSSDIKVAEMLLKKIPYSERIFCLDDRYNCCQLKSLISKCDFFIGARTHSTIAAYSTFVPTLVVGYSSKSIGIARDLFGDDKGYVCSVQNMKSDNELLEAFKTLFFEKEKIRDQLKETIPEYLKSYDLCVQAVHEIIRG